MSDAKYSRTAGQLHTDENGPHNGYQTGPTSLSWTHAGETDAGSAQLADDKEANPEAYTSCHGLNQQSSPLCLSVPQEPCTSRPWHVEDRFQ